MLARCRKRLAARGDDPDPGRGPEDLGREGGGHLEQVLAVVEDEQEMPLAKMREQKHKRLRAGLVAQVECRQHRVGDESGDAHLRQLDPPRAGGKAAAQICRCTQSEPRFADAARSDQADETGTRELLPQLGELVATADEARRFGRQVADAAGGLGHDRPKLLRTRSAIPPISTALGPA